MTTAGTDVRSVTGVPHPSLAGLVDGYHGYRITDVPPAIHHGLPSRELTLVIAFDDPLDVGWLGRDETRERFWTVASGLATAPAAIRHERSQFGIQLGLTPAGARALLGIPAVAIAGTLVPLSELVGPVETRLYDAVAGESGWEARFRNLDRELIRLRDLHHGTQDTTRPELIEAWRWLGHRVGRGTVGALAAEIGWSRRHLTDRFRAEYGVGPKEVARISRFGRSRALLARQAPPPLADIAVRCGYADQAHLTREWRAMSGYTPTQWRREEVAFVQDLPGSE